jgi:NAD(P)-dependent dehydrogenase (short-subunit alcohol dehydrogenase family)
MILLAFFLLTGTLFYNIYFYIFYRPRNIQSDFALVVGHNGSLFRQHTSSSILARNLIFQLAEKKCNIILVDTMENEACLSEMKKEIEDSFGTNCSYYCSDISSKEAVSILARKVGKVDILIHIPYFTSANITINENTSAVVGMKLKANYAVSSNSASSSPIAINHRNLIQGFLSDMIHRSSGHIVTVAGANGLFGAAASSSSLNILPQKESRKSKKDVDNDDDHSENDEDAALVNSIGANLRDAANQFALIGIAESLLFEIKRNLKKKNVKSTLICSAEVVGVFDNERMLTLARRTVEAICKGEEKVVTPTSLWFAQILKLLPATWTEKLIDSCKVFQVFGKK